ncbi:MAG: hypothetical protein H7X93_12515 [Sphingomonadaceae bacterium]|nr:hypothetical protein [Sphingomonadaceae bacterium]
MKRAAGPLRFAPLALALLVSAPLSAQDVPAEELETIAIRELGRIAAEWNVQPRYTFPEDGPIESVPDSGLSLGRARLAAYLASAPQEWRLDVLRWIIAHETWHQIQLLRTGGLIGDPGSADRPLAECEADMMAGLYVVETRGSGVDANWGGFAAIMDVARQVAQQSSGAANYPTGPQRQRAIQLGGWRGMIAHPVLLTAGEEQMYAVPWLRRLVDVRGEEEESTWATRQCRRILHADRAAIASLLQGQPMEQWSQDPEHPTVTFTIPYKNLGDMPLSVSVEIKTVAVLINAPEDQEQWLIIDAVTQDFELAPQGTYHLSGQLVWYGDAVRNSRLIYPLHESSLVSTRFLQGTEPAAPSPTLIPPGVSDSVLAFGGALQRVARTATDRFSSIIDNCAEFSGTNYCTSLVPIPGAEDTEIEMEASGEVRFVATLCQRCEESRAVEVYNRVAGELRALFPFKSFDERSTERSTRLQFRIQPSVDVVLSHLFRGSRDVVELRIEPRFAFE